MNCCGLNRDTGFFMRVSVRLSGFLWSRNLLAQTITTNEREHLGATEKHIRSL